MINMPDSKDDRFGKDLKIKCTVDKDGFSESDLELSRTGDLAVVQGEETVVQAIRNRLTTRHGELTELGHPEYGSLLETVIGEPNTEDTHRIIEALVRDSLQYEPRIENIIEITAVASMQRHDMVEINVMLKLRGEPEALKVVYPMYLEETL